MPVSRRALLLSAALTLLPLSALAEDRLKVVTTFTVIADMGPRFTAMNPPRKISSPPRMQT
jgi:hypothetical protein